MKKRLAALEVARCGAGKQFGSEVLGQARQYGCVLDFGAFHGDRARCLPPTVHMLAQISVSHADRKWHIQKTLRGELRRFRHPPACASLRFMPWSPIFAAWYGNCALISATVSHALCAQWSTNVAESLSHLDGQLTLRATTMRNNQQRQGHMPRRPSPGS